MEDGWRGAIRDRREAKDEYFRSNSRSPLPPDQREAFDGLSYYPVDEAFRFECALQEHDEPERVSVETSTGGEKTYVRAGEFHVTVEGEAVTVQAYRSDTDEERLWVPFRDATSGEETYGGGRYLDLEVETHRTDEGTWILDFNEAYNPTCAYSDRYECPLPPTENWLDVPIRAGEKEYE